MQEILTIVLLGALPGIGNLIGAVVAELKTPSLSTLNRSLHAASGVVIGIVSIELVPTALKFIDGYWFGGIFTLGGLTYVAIEKGIENFSKSGANSKRKGMWMIYVAVAIDLLNDGLVIGSGSAISSGLGLVLTSGQVLADLPEGFAAVANFRDKKLPRRKRMLLSLTFILYSTLAALLSFTLLKEGSNFSKALVLVFVAGLLSVTSVEDMLKEAHKAKEDTHRSVIAFIAGFALFAVVSEGLKSVH